MARLRESEKPALERSGFRVAQPWGLFLSLSHLLLSCHRRLCAALRLRPCRLPKRHLAGGAI